MVKAIPTADNTAHSYQHNLYPHHLATILLQLDMSSHVRHAYVSFSPTLKPCSVLSVSVEATAQDEEGREKEREGERESLAVCSLFYRTLANSSLPLNSIDITEVELLQILEFFLSAVSTKLYHCDTQTTPTQKMADRGRPDSFRNTTEEHLCTRKAMQGQTEKSLRWRRQETSSVERDVDGTRARRKEKESCEPASVALLSPAARKRQIWIIYFIGFMVHDDL